MGPGPLPAHMEREGPQERVGMVPGGQQVQVERRAQQEEQKQVDVAEGEAQLPGHLVA